MDQKIEQYLNNLVDECIKSASFSSLSEEEKSQKRELISDDFNQIVMDTLLGFMSKDELDQLESINFESEEGVQKFAEVASKLPSYVFLEIGDRLRLEAEVIKKDGSIPQ
jgi:hypothetical protein